VTLPRGTLGEHTDEVLEEAGIAAADRGALRASGITG
jgi:crotonobetainyl-CoA:carnitine CoA-transferase CaiB-like acyl-CoA transferase